MKALILKLKFLIEKFANFTNCILHILHFNSLIFRDRKIEVRSPDMWWILLLSCWSYPLLVVSMTWYPPLSRTVLNAMLGEQVDLVGADNATYAPEWTRNTANNGVNDATSGAESIDSIDTEQSPVNSVDRDREPLDEVERIEPRQWPGRPDILPTRSTAPFTTETSLVPRSSQPTTLAQRFSFLNWKNNPDIFIIY